MTGPTKTPILKRHKRSGNAFARFNGKQVWFGKFDDPQSRTEFAVYLAQWESNGRVPAAPSESGTYTVADLVAGYLVHAETYYRRADGSQTREIDRIRYTAKPLLDLFATLPVERFDLRCLKLVRERMIDSGLCRETVNGRVTKCVAIFGWGAEEELTPAAAFGALRALKSLKRNRTRAPEGKPVKPVSWSDVEPVLPKVSRQIAAMVLLQWHTGMRPGEAVRFRLSEVDKSQRVWRYKPSQHKTEHQGKSRVIPIGPKAQLVLSEFLSRGDQILPASAPLFSPRAAMDEFRARARIERKTPLWPSTVAAMAARKREHPAKVPGESYSVESYGRAIRTACKAAGVDHWSPNQLRHSAATRIKKELGLEAARAVLGHSSASTTEIYAEVDELSAADAMFQIG